MPPPAIVDTVPAGEIDRIRPFAASETTIAPLAATATAAGDQKRAAVPTPSTKPEQQKLQ
jgi:hypothetical protein